MGAVADPVLESDSLVLNHIHVARERAQGLRARTLVPLPKDPSSVHSPNAGQLTVISNTRSRDPIPPSHTTHTEIIKTKSLTPTHGAWP